MAIRTLRITSTAISAARYDKAQGQLLLTFIPNGRAYAFTATPKEVKAFQKAGSKGQYYNRVFRPRGGTPVG